MIEAINCGVVLEDEKGFILYLNQQMLDWTGYEPADLDHQPSSMLLPLDMRDALEVERERFLGGEHRTILSAIRRRNGRTFPVAVSPTPVSLVDGSRGVLSVCLDLGELQTARPLGAQVGSMQEGLAEIAMFNGGYSHARVAGRHLERYGRSAATHRGAATLDGAD